MTPFDSTGTEDGRKQRFADYLPPMTTATWYTLAVGVILGFTLGLIVAWGIFPVQWANAWPGDLTQEARAQYLASVAESYVYYSDEQAAEVARNRLFDLNENLAEEIAAAQAFFLDSPQRNARVHVSNLGQLAQALNVESPDIILDVPAAEGETGAVVPEPAEGSVSDTVRAWVNWTLTLLAAVLLVGGGIYIIGRLNQRRKRDDTVDYVEGDEPGGFEDESPRYGAPGRNPFMRPTGTAPSGGSVRGTALGTAAAAGVAESRQQDEYGFEEEDDDDVVFSQGRTLTDDRPSAPFVAADEDAYPADPYERQAAAEDEAHYDDPFDDDVSPAAFDRAPQTAAGYGDEDFDDAYVDADEDDELVDDEDLVDEPLIPVPAASSRAAFRSPADLPVLHTYTVHYQAGMLDYDQSYSILNPEGGRYIGDCGMGVNMKNGVLQNSPESVIALDVWLVDKKQEKSYSSQTRVLLSEYADDHNLGNVFERDRPGDQTPFVPHPGTKFQLHGPSLLLDCEILEADYISDGESAGVFQNLKIDMTVRSLD